jgi:uncharacterized membrane protein (DUF2068 family)
VKQKRGLHHYFGLRAVAVFEFIKGFTVLLIGLGLISLVHRDVQDAAERILHTLHFDPTWSYSKMFVEKASQLNDTAIRRLSVLAFAYSTFRIVEAYGLWYERLWAEWLAVATASLYVPAEINHLWKHFTTVHLCVLVGNLLIVAYLVYVLWDNHRVRAAEAAKIAARENQPAPADKAQ